MEINIVEELLKMTLLGTEWVLWLLIVASILSVALILERSIFFFRLRFDMKSFTETMNQLLLEGKIDELKDLCNTSSGFEAEVIKRGLDQTKRGPAAMNDTMDSYIVGKRQLLDRGLVFLGTMGNNAPFIGLFGTVLGIIQAFTDLANSPEGGPSVVMAGISEALVATAVGLLVAIPAVVAFNVFQRMIKRHMANAESVKKILLSHFSQS